MNPVEEFNNDAMTKDSIDLNPVKEVDQDEVTKDLIYINPVKENFGDVMSKNVIDINHAVISEAVVDINIVIKDNESLDGISLLAGTDSVKEDRKRKHDFDETNKTKNKCQPKILLSTEVYNLGLSEFCLGNETLHVADDCKTFEIRQSILKYLPDITITSVKKVENNYITGMYHLKKEEYKSRHTNFREETLFHSTSECNVLSIIQDNFDWTRVHRYKYGKGISFSSDADYANCHANRRNGNSRAFIITKVLIGNTASGSSCLKIPGKGFDTTTKAGNLVVVKYNNNEFLPEFVAYYNFTGDIIRKSKYY